MPDDCFDWQVDDRKRREAAQVKNAVEAVIVWRGDGNAIELVCCGATALAMCASYSEF